MKVLVLRTCLILAAEEHLNMAKVLMNYISNRTLTEEEREELYLPTKNLLVSFSAITMSLFYRFPDGYININATMDNGR